MLFDLKRPCKNCPFRNDKTRITFACRERAEEIEESAYRNGFPCHLSADHIEGDNLGGEGGFVFGPATQHCAGAILMFLKEGNTAWPGIDNDEGLAEKLAGQMDWSAPVFECAEDFFDANT